MAGLEPATWRRTVLEQVRGLSLKEQRRAVRTLFF